MSAGDRAQPKAWGTSCASDEAGHQRSHFAPPERATEAQIRELSELALAHPVMRIVLETIGGYAMVLDDHRQIIAANPTLLELLRIGDVKQLEGMRPGEAFDCVNARRGPVGCGTSIQCRHCGAVSAILAAQVANEPIEGQCTLSCQVDEAIKSLEFRVRVSPLSLGGLQTYVFVLYDITSVVRRELLERSFLHDLANLMTGLLGWTDELARLPLNDAASQVIDLTQRLSEHLDEQRMLVRCEAGELTLSPEPVDLSALTYSLRAWFATHTIARSMDPSPRQEVKYVIARDEDATTLYTDRRLLMRVLGNLLKNACEAVAARSLAAQSSPLDVNVPPSGATLTITAQQSQTLFEVHNPGAMAPEVSARLLKERFSTKGPGRGLGMYAVQLFGEQYLGGQLTFTSSEDAGTCFRFCLPNTQSGPMHH